MVQQSKILAGADLLQIHTASCCYTRQSFHRLTMLHSSFDKRFEQRMAVTRGGSKFRMELHTDKPWMDRLRQFHHFGQGFAWCACCDYQPIFFEGGHIIVVDFLAMAIA